MALIHMWMNFPNTCQFYKVNEMEEIHKTIQPLCTSAAAEQHWSNFDVLASEAN